MAKKHVDPLKAKQKKQKIVAGVLGVLFVGLLGFQVPRVMKQLHPPPPQHSSSPTTPAAPVSGTPLLAAPTLRGAEQAPAAPSPDGSLASVGAPVQDGQLASFSRFASKDPFAQQLGGSKGSSTGSSGSGSSGSGTGTSTPAGGNGKESSSGVAVISVNGTLYSVPVGTDFPQASPTDQTLVPVFHLVSLTAHTAKISIVGGSYSSGAPAVTLQEKKTVTLMNTADGTRYKITLMPQGTEVASPTPSTTTTPETVTIPPTTP
jgi:hypothetical protein